MQEHVSKVSAPSQWCDARKWLIEAPSRLASAATSPQPTGFLVAVQPTRTFCVPSASSFEDRNMGSLHDLTDAPKRPKNASEHTFGCAGKDAMLRSRPGLLR